MRPRAAVLATLVTAVGCVSLPALAQGAPHRNHGLTIAATPNPIVSGDAVLIYGQLNVPNPGNRRIVLYHRINPNSFFTVIGTTRTTPTGFYEFTREEGVVLTNRSWFVRAPELPGRIHSRTVHEHVAAEVSLNPPTSTAALTGQPVTFTGAVAPDHRGEPVLLQEETGQNGNGWKTVKQGTLDGASQFSITTWFKVPGDHTVRAFFPEDPRNTSAASDTQTVTVQQKEKPGFTINTSAPIIQVGGSANITGVLASASAQVTMVTLWGHTAGQPFAPIQTAPTGAGGSYTFTVTPANNTEYQVRTTFAPNRSTARLFEGVKDAVSIMASANSSSVGQSVTFTGAVAPDKAGDVIELERLGKDGRYHPVAQTTVTASSAYQFTWTFGAPGLKSFRVHIPSDPGNVGASSTPVMVMVGLPSVTSLPPAS